MSESVNIGRTIARERRRAGATQEALAAHLGVSKAAVSKWELGQSLPDVSLLPRIAAYFSLTLDELFDWRDELTSEESAALYAEVYALGEKNLATAHKRLRALATEHYRKLGRDDEAIELLQAERLRAASFVLSSLMQEVGMRDDAAFARVAGNAAEVVFEALDMGTVNPFFSATMSLEVAEVLRKAGEKDAALDALARAIDAATLEHQDAADSPLWDRMNGRLEPARAGEAWAAHKSRQADEAGLLIRRGLAERTSSPEWQRIVSDDPRYRDILAKTPR